jgi:hypothetical protein
VIYQPSYKSLHNCVEILAIKSNDASKKYTEIN